LLAKHELIGEPVLAMLASGALTAALGFATSFLVLRGSDLTRLMVTLGVALVLREIANKLDWLTGGADGLQGVMMAPVLGIFDFDIAGRTAYVYSAAVAFALFLIARRIAASPFGLSLRSIKDNPLRAAAVGIPVTRRLIAIYTIAAGYAGIAGALLTQTTQFASLSVFDFDRSADVLLVLIIGGVGYLYGGFIGAIVFKLGQDWLSHLTPQYWHFWVGLFLVIFVLVGRDRLMRWNAAVRAFVARLGPARRPQPAAGQAVRD
jgi:branched-chain amino acid transport system permease protein